MLALDSSCDQWLLLLLSCQILIGGACGCVCSSDSGVCTLLLEHLLSVLLSELYSIVLAPALELIGLVPASAPEIEGLLDSLLCMIRLLLLFLIGLGPGCDLSQLESLITFGHLLRWLLMSAILRGGGAVLV